MDKELYNLLIKLKENIENSIEKQNLKNCDNDICNDNDVIRLSINLQNCANEYNDAIKFNLPNIDDYKKRVYDAKLEIDKNEKVVKYYECYRAYKELYDYFNTAIIEPFNLGIKL